MTNRTPPFADSPPPPPKRGSRLTYWALAAVALSAALIAWLVRAP